MRFTLNPFTHRFDAFEQDQPGSSDIETITPDVGGPVGPDAGNNLNLVGGPGIITIDDGTPNTIKIQRTTYVTETAITDDEAVPVPANVIEFDMGTFPGVYTLTGKIAARNVTSSEGGGYTFSACFRTDGAAGTLINVNYGIEFEEASMEDSDYDVLVSGNNIVIQVTGVANSLIHWAAEFDYTLAL